MKGTAYWIHIRWINYFQFLELSSCCCNVLAFYLLNSVAGTMKFYFLGCYQFDFMGVLLFCLFESIYFHVK